MCRAGRMKLMRLNPLHTDNRQIALVATLTCVLCAPAVTVAAAPSPATQPRAATTPAAAAGLRVHDPSTIVECNGEYWFFATGSGVRSFRSRDLRQWEPGPRVHAELPEWTRRYPLRDDRLWAPDVIRSPDGRYLLYYSASSFGKNTSAVGLASNVTLDPRDPHYKWV